MKRDNAKRGQGFVVFRDTASATAALRAAQCAPFLEGTLKLEYARTKSQATSLLEGRVEASASAAASKRGKVAAFAAAAKNAAKEAKKTAAAMKAGYGCRHMDADDDDEIISKAAAAAGSGSESAHPVLYLTGLPGSLTVSGGSALAEVFRPYAGFREVHAVPGGLTLPRRTRRAAGV
ncbi:hypothetical protein HK405_004220 [Cladochytrium tenue]|nr:hypothetical protein HK405_004220 [Cladochytrium tenue]